MANKIRMRITYFLNKTEVSMFWCALRFSNDNVYIFGSTKRINLQRMRKVYMGIFKA